MDWPRYWSALASREARGPAQVLGAVGRLGAGDSADGLQALMLLMSDEDLVRVVAIVREAANEAPDDAEMRNAFDLLVGALQNELDARGLDPEPEPWR